MKILFFIGTLCAGGKERQLIELLFYLKRNTNYDLLVVLRRNLIEYPAFKELNIPCIKLTENYKKGDKTLHFRFYKICRQYRPNIIHTWGGMPAFVSILAITLLRIPHINFQIQNVAPPIKKWNIKNLINRINFKFSKIIIANSYAGLAAYRPEKRKSKVIYNGINMNRFNNLPDKQLTRNKYGLCTSYIIIMVASFSDNKDYDLFVEIAKIISFKRNDVTFLAIGSGIHLERIKKKVFDDQIKNVLFTGLNHEVENLIDIADIGVLFSPNGEGISNSIMEYMALGKPVIANDAGGTKEIVRAGVSGYLITNESSKEIAGLINELLSDKEKKQKMGEVGRKLIHESFTIDRMGKEFDKVYHDILNKE